MYTQWMLKTNVIAELSTLLDNTGDFGPTVLPSLQNRVWKLPDNNNCQSNYFCQIFWFVWANLLLTLIKKVKMELEAALCVCHILDGHYEWYKCGDISFLVLSQSMEWPVALQIIKHIILLGFW